MNLKREKGASYAVVWLALLALVVALLGGSSRFDAVQAAALRPLAALFLIPALYWMTRDKFEIARVPLFLLGLTALWTALQLVPLPSFLWQSLPGREAVAELDAIHGLEGTWRPISFVPIRGWNALFALIIPAAAALLAVALRPTVKTVLLVLVGLGVLDAALGLLQVLDGKDSVLYFYEHTNAGSPVGIFANENHSGVFSAMMLLVIGRLAFGARKDRAEPAFKLGLAAAFLVVSMGLLISGSRAAFGLALVAYPALASMAFLWLKRPSLDGEKGGIVAWAVGHPKLTGAVGLAIIAGLLLALFQTERAPGLESTLSQDAFEDLRWRISPLLGELMSTYWLFGSGFGSFDAVYAMVEPTNLMRSTYLNQAHNDWAQIVIEGGIPAIFLLLATLRWIGFAIRSNFSREPDAIVRCMFWGAIFAFVGVASLFDYPLRTPVFQLAGAWLMIALAYDVRDTASWSRGQ